MSSQQDNLDNPPPTTPITVDTSDQDFSEIINLITAMHTPVPSTRSFFTTPQHHNRRSYLFDPRRLTFGETIEDDSEMDENQETPTEVEHPLPELTIQGVATMPLPDTQPSTPDTQPSTPNEEERFFESDSSNTDEENDTKECCVCYKTKTDINTIVLPTCGHIICQSCFFRWLRTSPTCPMCRDNLTSWDRVSNDTIKDDIYEITKLFNRVSKTHNSLMHRCEDLRHTTSHLRKKNTKLRDENRELKCSNNGIMSAIIRRRKYTDYIRGYNAAIMTGDLMEDQTHLRSTDYKDGIIRGIVERDKFLKTMGIKPDEFLKVQPHLLSLIQSTHQTKKGRNASISIRSHSDRDNLHLDNLFKQDEDY